MIELTYRVICFLRCEIRSKIILKTGYDVDAYVVIQKSKEIYNVVGQVTRIR